MTSQLHSAYPWTTSPFIANAPMGGYAESSLAIAVSKSKGLGFLGPPIGKASLAAELEKVSQAFFSQPEPPEGKTLPVGVGTLPFIFKLADVVAIVQKYRPVALWLFAAHNLSDFAVWAKEIRAASPQTQIWIQIGSVAGALEVAKLCAPDVLVLQGTDAGGHGWERGASVISLLPEATDVLAANGFGNIPLVASGGIADGRGVAAALALGADGAVMGTRFLGAHETTVPHQGYRDGVLAAKDGGQSTVKVKVFDELKGPSIWPELFDGRAVVSESYTDHVAGKGVEELRELFKSASTEDGAGYGIEGKGRAIIWAGTGVGLVNEVKAAGDIVEEVREDAKKAIEKAKARL